MYDSLLIINPGVLFYPYGVLLVFIFGNSNNLSSFDIILF